MCRISVSIHTCTVLTGLSKVNNHWNISGPFFLSRSHSRKFFPMHTTRVDDYWIKEKTIENFSNKMLLTKFFFCLISIQYSNFINFQIWSGMNDVSCNLILKKSRLSCTHWLWALLQFCLCCIFEEVCYQACIIQWLRKMNVKFNYCHGDSRSSIYLRHRKPLLFRAERVTTHIKR